MNLTVHRVFPVGYSVYELYCGHVFVKTYRGSSTNIDEITKELLSTPTEEIIQAIQANIAVLTEEIQQNQQLVQTATKHLDRLLFPKTHGGK